MDDYWYNLSLRYLTIRPRSEKELSDYLKKKKVTDTAITSIISRLKSLKFLNDEEFARWWIDQRTRLKPKGKRLIALELHQKGISQEIIDSIYHSSEEVIIPDKEKAIALLEKKKERYKHLTREELYKKLGSMLMRRGFDYDSILKSIDEVFGK